MMTKLNKGSRVVANALAWKARNSAPVARNATTIGEYRIECKTTPNGYVESFYVIKGPVEIVAKYRAGYREDGHWSIKPKGKVKKIVEDYSRQHNLKFTVGDWIPNSAPVAKNADDGSVLVSIKTIDESGMKTLRPVKMSSRELEDWMKKIGCGGQFQGVCMAIMNGRDASVSFPQLGATIKAL